MNVRARFGHANVEHGGRAEPRRGESSRVGGVSSRTKANQRNVEETLPTEGLPTGFRIRSSRGTFFLWGFHPELNLDLLAYSVGLGPARDPNEVIRV